MEPDVTDAVEAKPSRATMLGRIHHGLPVGAPRFVRIVLRSRWFLVATFALTLLLGITAVVTPDWLLNVDKPMADWVRSSGGDPSVAKAVTQLGSPNLAIAAGALAVVVMWQSCRASALTLGALLVATLMTDLVLKILIDRPRPSDQLVSTQFGSFPSGHTIYAVVIFGMLPLLLWILSKRPIMLRAGFALSALVVALVAWSRVRLGAHWPSDVLASVFIGASLLIAAEQLLVSNWAANRCSAKGHHST